MKIRGTARFIIRTRIIVCHDSSGQYQYIANNYRDRNAVKNLVLDLPLYHPSYHLRSRQANTRSLTAGHDTVQSSSVVSTKNLAHNP